MVNRLIRDIALAAVPPVRRLHAAHQALLGEHSSLTVEHEHLGANVAELGANLAVLGARLAVESSPFWHYSSVFDVEEVIRRHAVPDLQPSPAHLTNFLGVRIDPKFFPTILDGQAGKVEQLPFPGNWHADVAEWGAALRAVDLAGEAFTVIELGCGWGCWMNSAGAAARRSKRQVQLIGIEADEGHIGFAHEAFAINGFKPHEVILHRGIAAPKSGTALFPRQDQAGVDWGLEPIFNATEEQRQASMTSGRYDELPMISLNEIVAPYTRIDLLHIDIQGGEADFIDGCLPVMQERVAYLVVGTHSRPIEGHIMNTLREAGWMLEVERPALYSGQASGLHLRADGIQGWRNPVLSPSPDAGAPQPEAAPPKV